MTSPRLPIPLRPIARSGPTSSRAPVSPPAGQQPVLRRAVTDSLADVAAGHRRAGVASFAAMASVGDPGGSGALTGAGLGALAALGVLLAFSRLPWRRRPRLEDRLAPYVRDAAPSRLLPTPTARSPLATLERLLAPVMVDAARWVDRLTGGPTTVRRRLDQLGTGKSLEQFRAEQVVWGVLGTAAGIVAGLLMFSAGGVKVVPFLIVVVVGGTTGVLARDQLLTTAVRRREERILAEFPTVAELLALAVAAGEGPIAALERVARTCSGELAAELGRTLADARAGASLLRALEGLAARTTLPSLARFVDGVSVAVERGTPLADVLRAQASDVRELSRRRLMETGGKKEIGMMVPVVFLVLPVTVLFVVYPGLAVLDLNL